MLSKEEFLKRLEKYKGKTLTKEQALEVMGMTEAEHDKLTEEVQNAIIMEKDYNNDSSPS